MDKVRCPYPHGGEMKLIAEYRETYTKYNYACSCGARSPSCTTPDAAYAAAMQRYEPENRVLTLLEVLTLDLDGATCIEDKASGEIEAMLNSEILGEFEELRRSEGIDAASKAYGRFSRAWLRRPTDAEREAVEWE